MQGQGQLYLPLCDTSIATHRTRANVHSLPVMYFSFSVEQNIYRLNNVFPCPAMVRSWVLPAGISASLSPLAFRPGLALDFLCPVRFWRPLDSPPLLVSCLSPLIVLLAWTSFRLCSSFFCCRYAVCFLVRVIAASSLLVFPLFIFGCRRPREDCSSASRGPGRPFCLESLERKRIERIR